VLFTPRGGGVRGLEVKLTTHIYSPASSYAFKGMHFSFSFFFFSSQVLLQGISQILLPLVLPEGDVQFLCAFTLLQLQMLLNIRKTESRNKIILPT
jgi:hypothetical protein